MSKFREWLTSIGADIEEDDGMQTMHAPVGYFWNASGCTTCCAERNIAALEADARHGLRKCTPEESAEFEHIRDEAWTAPAASPPTIPGYRTPSRVK